ncbi:MAG: hypothetical protein FWF78_08080 [Defluviitaleaceae bacterium]|nr:hypothetical protein [Defluviitaleaceae bacterium]
MYKKLIGYNAINYNSAEYLPAYPKDNRCLLCRFCGKDAEIPKHGSGNHAIPEFFGNRYLFTVYECNKCGGIFNKMCEDHLSKNLNPIRTILGIKGKNGLVDFNSDGLYMKHNVEVKYETKKKNNKSYQMRGTYKAHC